MPKKQNSSHFHVLQFCCTSKLRALYEETKLSSNKLGQTFSISHTNKDLLKNEAVFNRTVMTRYLHTSY